MCGLKILASGVGPESWKVLAEQRGWKRTKQLEQLERLPSEIPPATPWLPILVIHIRSQVKTKDKVKVTNFLKIAKNSNFVETLSKFCKKLNMQHTFWGVW